MYGGNAGSVMDESTLEAAKIACDFIGIDVKELEKLCCVKKIKTPTALIEKYCT